LLKNGGVRKISFASSIGITDLTVDERRYYKRWLKDYDAISVREVSGCDILKGIMGREIVRVSDPTFLLSVDYWQSLAVQPKANIRYMLLFTLEADVLQLEYAILIAKQSGLKLLVVQRNNGYKFDERYTLLNDLSVEEWLGYIQSAELVLTDSFHATLFSIILDSCNFFTYISPISDRGSRIIDLLKLFDLEDHLLNSSLDTSYDELNSKNINRKKVMGVIDRERNESRLFLKENIKTNGGKQ
jgi:hypothetical protein